MENGFLNKAKQGLMGFSGLRELILEKIPFLEKERGEKGKETYGKKRIKFWVGLFFISCF